MTRANAVGREPAWKRAVFDPVDQAARPNRASSSWHDARDARLGLAQEPLANAPDDAGRESRQDQTGIITYSVISAQWGTFHMIGRA